MQGDEKGLACQKEISRLSQGTMLRVLEHQRESLRADLAALEAVRFKNTRVKNEIYLTKERIAELDAEIRRRRS